MERKLASIQEIIDLRPIPNADAIEVATVLGWKVVVKKGEFKVGDSCVYCEIDSILPALPKTEFLAPKYRVKTIRLRGQVSQGICFPLSILKLSKSKVVHIGMDVTELFGVTKYEPPIPAGLEGKVRGVFPSFIPRTDEPRLQAYPELLKKYFATHFIATEKVDGTSGTFFVKNGELHCCSRNWDLSDSGNMLWKLAKKYQLFDKLKGTNIALQGEIVGEGIQGNKLKIEGKRIYFFNAYNFEEARYLDFHEYSDFIVQNDLVSVRVLFHDVLLPETISGAVGMATIKSVINPDVWVEGLVFRPLKEIHDEDLGRLSFKVINPEFLLKYKV